MLALLIRHGHTDAVGKWLAGRRPGESLSVTGRRQAEDLSRALRWLPLTAVYSSPLERAIQTAQPLARDCGLTIATSTGFTELDFGDWTGKTFDELAGEPAWLAFNQDRATACPPRGEPLTAAQVRIITELEALARRHEREMVAVVTHAELIRCAIAAFRNLTLDEAARIDISPAHISTVGLEHQLRRVLGVNVRPGIAAA